MQMKRRWVLRSSGMLRSVDWQFRADASGQPIGPFLEVQEVHFFLDILSFEGGTDSLSRNVIANTLRCLTPRKSADLISMAAEAWNHASEVYFNRQWSHLLIRSSFLPLEDQTAS